MPGILRLAARRGLDGCVRMLLSRLSCENADDVGGVSTIVNAVGMRGKTALHHAVLSGHRRVLEVLLSVPNIEVNTAGCRGITMLHLAAKK